MKRTRIVFGLICIFLLIGVICPIVHAEQYTKDDKTYTYEVLEDGTAKLLSVTGLSSRAAVEVPRKLDGHIVSAIGYGFLDEALSKTDELVRLYIPNTVTQIDPGFLKGVTLFSMNMTRDQGLLELEEGNPVYSYQFSAETGCLIETDTAKVVAVPEHRDEIITITPGAKILGAEALRDMNIKTLWLPASLEEVEHGALDATDGIRWLQLEEGNSHFSIDAGVLVDAAGNRIYPPENPVKEAEPEETEPTLTPEQQQAREKKERINRWVNTLFVVGVVLLLVAVIAIIWHTRRGQGQMMLNRVFGQPSLFFFDVILCTAALLLSQILEEETLWLADDKLALTMLLVAGILGIIGVFMELVTAGPIWALPRLVFKGVLITLVAGLSLTEGIFRTAVYLLVIWRAFANAAMGVWVVYNGIGIAAFIDEVGNVADMVADNLPERFSPLEEIQDFRYEDYSGTERRFLGPDGGFVHIKETPYSRTGEVTYNGKKYTATKMPDGSWTMDQPLSEARQSAGSSNKTYSRIKASLKERIFTVIIGACQAAPSILFIIRLFKTLY